MTIEKTIKVTGIGWSVIADNIDTLFEDGLITEEEANRAYEELEADLPTEINLNIVFGGEDGEAMDLRCLHDDDAITQYIMEYLYENYGYYPAYFNWEEES